MAWYYCTGDEENWLGDFPTREAAIVEGRDSVGPDAGFMVAQGEAHAPRSVLFDDTGDLAEFFDDRNEDAAFEDPFTAEANLSDDDFRELLAQINAAYGRWLARHNPRSRALHLGPWETIPPEAPENMRADRQKVTGDPQETSGESANG